MSKIFTRLTLLILILFFFFLFLPKTTLAAECSFIFNPDPPNQNMDNLSVTINSHQLPTGNYYVDLKYPSDKSNTPVSYPFHAIGISELENNRGNIGSDDTVSFSNINGSSFTFKKPGSPGSWDTGTYRIYFWKKGTQPSDTSSSCQTNFPIAPRITQNCSILVLNTPMDPGTGVLMTTTDIDNGRYDIKVDNIILSDSTWGNRASTYIPGYGKTVDLGTFSSAGNGPRNYTIDLYKDGRPQCNSGHFTVYPSGSVPSPNPNAPPGANNKCAVSPQPASQVDNILLTAQNLPSKTKFSAAREDTSNHFFFDVATDPRYSKNLTSSDQETISIPLVEAPGNGHPLGDYVAHLYDANKNEVCKVPYKVQDEKDLAAQKLAELQKCIDEKRCVTGGGEPCGDDRGPAFKTAIGCVHTNPAEFVKDLMTWVIGIGGGIAFLMMLLGAFQMLTSAGNPETLQAGRDRLTSAVIGLLFVIFAILLLQIIGVGILNLPGFK